MNANDLRRLLYSSGAIALLGILLAMFALDTITDSMALADRAVELGSSAISSGGGSGVTATALPALVELELANIRSSEGTLLLGLAGTLTPILIFLNVLGYVGQYAPGQNDPKFRKVVMDAHGKPDPDQLRLSD